MVDYMEHCGEEVNEPTPPEHESNDGWRNCVEQDETCGEYLAETKGE